MWRTTEGSTGRLIQLCFAYFFFYIITGVTVKYFQGPVSLGLPGMKGMEFLFYSTLGGVTIALSVCVVLGWFRMQSNQMVKCGPFEIPVEYAYIIPSGVCTAVVIPTTTLMYSLPISVMVAMVIMRGSVIIISRIVDTVQIWQGLLKKKVYWDENAAVVFAVLAVAMEIYFKSGKGAFAFVRSPMAMIVLASYIVAYAIRIYIFNYYKNTRGKGVKQDNRGFFAVEQTTAVLVLLAVGTFVALSPDLFGWNVELISEFRGAITKPRPLWGGALLAGAAFGMVSFFSVFIFMFKGRTATFAGLVNRLTSLIAGTTATLVFHFGFGGQFPQKADWVSLVFILIAIAFLTTAEKKRTKELSLAQ